MKSLLFQFIVVLAFFSSCKTSSNTIKTNEATSNSYQSIIDSFYRLHPEAIGLMVHLESPDKYLSWSGCAGVSDKDQQTKLLATQPALIASSIKPYVAATILRLEEMNKLTIEDPIGDYLTEKTAKLYSSDGYNLSAIKIKHLLAHRSGIYNYANAEYLDLVSKDKQHRWTRDEQLARTISIGDPLGNPLDTFVYTDANFLLATEIIETVYEQPFYTAMRDLLKYKDLGLKHTWFPTLEKPNPNTLPLAHQYWTEKGWDSYEIDISFDLYGGGGLAATTRELATFTYALFNGNIIKDPIVLNKIFTKVIPDESKDNGYCLGLVEVKANGYTSYGHGGFWGTTMEYYPELDLAVAVYVLDRSQGKLRRELINSLVKQFDRDEN